MKTTRVQIASRVQRNMQSRDGWIVGATEKRMPHARLYVIVDGFRLLRELKSSVRQLREAISDGDDPGESWA